MRPAFATCFHEADPDIALVRRAAAEALGTLLLVFAAGAGGIAAVRLLPATPALAAPLVAVTVAGALVSLIVAFGKVSGGHFNPLITLSQMIVGERTVACAVTYVVAQMLGGLAGGRLAAAVWRDVPAAGGGIGWRGFGSEFIASAGLMLIVFGSARSGQAIAGPFAVGAWLVAAVIATPTGSYANPAVVGGALLTAGPLALGAGSLVPYMLAQVAGALVALGLISFIAPPQGERS